MSEKSTVYNPKIVEDSYYKIWEERGYFEIDGNKNIQAKDKNGKKQKLCHYDATSKCNR